MSSPYAVDKLLHHESALHAIEQGVDAPLIQVHLMPSLVCGHRCAWCVVEGSLVDLMGGARVPIERVAVGDRVQVDTHVWPVVDVFERVANKVVEIIVAGRPPLRVTPEHPVFMSSGKFVEAGAIYIGDKIAVRSADPPPPANWIYHQETVAQGWSARDRVPHFSGRLESLSFARVDSVREIVGPVRVYNLHCPPGEAFIANGFLTHNCSYQARDPSDVAGWKNRQLVNQRQVMPGAKYLALPSDLADMGVQAVELTGGGEPFNHPQTAAFLDLMAQTSMSLGVVSHGAMIRELEADLIAACRWKWARISIDAGTAPTYCTVRRVEASQWGKAWRAVRMLAERRAGDVRVGVGFVVDSVNWREVGACIALAREAGADNVRVSLAFTPEGLGRFPERERMMASIAEQVAAERAIGGIDVFDLVTERAGNIAAGAQDYALCAWKEVGCVIGGDCNAYACCSWAFNKAGLITSFADRPFSEAWRSPEAQAWRRRHDAREACPITCLYEARNLRALELIDMGAEGRGQLRQGSEVPPHVEFI